jgi:alpha-beta hydrolase superfamily lysophospholipase
MLDRREFIKAASAVAVSGLISVAPYHAIAAGPTRLVLVHGRAQQGLNAETLESEWLDALKRGAGPLGLSMPSGIDVAFPFYGDVLDNFTRQFDIPLTSDMQARGNPVDDEFLVFQAEFAESIRQRAGITDAQVDAEYGSDPSQRGPLNWRWVQAILRAIDRNSAGMSQKTLEAFTRDVFLYTTRASVRDEINRIVASKLTEQPTVIVSHSLGTVVAYNVLTTDRRSLHIPLLVTVGSPLAVRAVRDQFLPLRSPSSVASWYNAFDTRDVVALYPLDANNFPVRPAVVNNPTVKNYTENRHGIAGYLDDPDVARQILTTLRA